MEGPVVNRAPARKLGHPVSFGPWAGCLCGRSSYSVGRGIAHYSRLMTDIESVHALLANAKNLGLAAGFTPLQLDAYKALWYAVDSLTDLIEGR